MSIRTRLLLLVLASALPAFIMLAWELAHSAQAARERAHETITALAVNTAGEIELAMRDKQTLLSRAATLPLGQGQAACNQALAEYVRLYPVSISFSVRDAQGRPLCSSRADAVPYDDHIRQGWLAAAFAAPGFHASAPVYGVRSERWLTILSYPRATPPERERELLILPLDLLILQERVLHHRPANGRLTVVAHNGAVLMDTADDGRLVGRPAPPGLLPPKGIGSRGVYRSAGADGAPWLSALTAVDGHDGWYVLASLPEREVMAEHDAHQRRALAYAAFVLAVSLLLAWRLASAIARPIRVLAGAAQRAASGEAGVRAEVAGPAETRLVAQQFNAMLDVRDADARKLAESNSRYTAMIDASGLLMYEWDTSTGAMVYGGRMQQMIGYAPEEMEGGLERWTALVHPDDVDAFRRESMRSLQTGTGFSLTYRIFRKDGACLTVEDRGHFVTDASGRRHRMVGFVTDITERERSRDEIVKLNATLEQRVAERTAQLDHSNRELNAFSYAVSHDLRAPLRGIDGWSLALLEDCGDALDERGHEYLGRVRAETQRMGRLIDDLLLLSRTSQAEMHTAEVDVSTIAAEIAAKLRTEQPERQVEFAIAPGLRVRGDAGLLRIALTNLLENAWKFTSRVDRGRIEFGSAVVDGQHAFFVRDNGAGFDMRYAGKLFAPFQRMHKASEFPGSGIGLATVQRIVLRHGGRIWAESQPGFGATFYFTLERIA